MKTVQIIHNPSAGNERHSKKSLLELVVSNSYNAQYVSTNELGWKNLVWEGIDFLLLAGGDGTVRKIASVLINRERNAQPIPIFLLPLGTANNIGKTLKIHENPEELFNEIALSKTKSYDYGSLKGLADINFFIEGMGFGVFPQLMMKMKKNKRDNELPNEKLQRTLSYLPSLIEEIVPEKVRIVADGKEIEDEFILVELLNIKSIGPNLTLAPDADPGDAYFELVMIKAKYKDDILKYIESKKEISLQKYLTSIAEITKVKQVQLIFPKSPIHVDDELIWDYNGAKIDVNLVGGRLAFIV